MLNIKIIYPHGIIEEKDIDGSFDVKVDEHYQMWNYVHYRRNYPSIKAPTRTVDSLPLEEDQEVN